MSATEAVVQFIGIIMMTAGVPNDPGVHAIVPRIERSGLGSPVERRQAVPRTQRSAAGIVPFRPQGVEAHTALILYQTSARIGEADWTPVPFGEAYEYVVLKGERLQFVTGAVNAAPAVPRDLPRACPTTTTTLQASFQAPQYAGAAAVVDIGEGFLEACLAQPGGTANGRADTRLFLKTNGTLVLVGTKANQEAKTITFQPDARVYIANVPSRLLDAAGTLVAPGGPPHHTVYDTMVGASNCSSPDTSNICRICEASAMKTTGGGVDPFPLMVDSECSNSQWP